MNLIILGAGQYGRVVKEVAEELGYTIKFLDDNNAAPEDRLSGWQLYEGFFFVAIGDAELRMEWIDKLEKGGKKIATLIAEMAYVSPSAVIGRGSLIEPMAVVNTGSQLGRGVFVCAGAVVNHNATVSDGCQIDTNATVPSGAIVPEMTKVLAGASWKTIPKRPLQYDFDAVM